MRPTQTEPFKCGIHTKKDVEYYCTKDNEFFCSLCMLEHGKHSDDIVVATEDEILRQYRIVADNLN